MKKRLLSLALAFLAVLALLAVAIFLKSGEEPADEDPNNSSTQSSTVTVLSAQWGEIEKLEYVNEHGSYTVLKREDGSAYFEGFEDLPTLYYSTRSLLSGFSSLVSIATIEEDVQDVSAYGLDNPQATLVLHLTDGTTRTICFGNKTHTSSGYYFMVDGSKTVFLSRVDYAEKYIKPIDSYINLKLNTATDSERTISEIVSFNIEKPDGEKINFRVATEEELAEWSFRYFTGYAVENGTVNWGGNSELVTGILNTLTSLTADAVITYDITEENLTKYGFDSPTKVSYECVSSVTQTGVSENLTASFTIGTVNNSVAYVMYGDSPVIYQVPATAFSFIKNGIDTFCTGTITIMKYISDMDTVTFRLNGEDHVFILRNSSQSETFDPTVFYNNEYTVAYKMGTTDENGEEIPSFQDLYLSALSVSLNGMAENPEGEPYLSITYLEQNGSENTVSFHLLGDRNYFVAINGVGFFYTTPTEVNEIVETLQELIASKRD